MAKRQILVFFPHNVNLLTTGAHKRFYELFQYLIENGFEIDLISLVNYEDKWDPKKDIVSKIQIRNLFLFDHSFGLKQKLIYTLAFRRVFNFIFCKRDSYHRLPDYTFPGLNKEFNKIVNASHYNFVLISYVYWANLIKNTINYPCKTILTIEDHISLNLFQRYPRQINFEKFNQEEIRRINLFDEVICISYQDYMFFSKSAIRPRFYHIPVFLDSKPVKPLSEKKYDLLFIGSDNESNKKGMRWFFDEVYPLLSKKIRILIVGKITVFISDYTNVMKIPFIENLDDAYFQSMVTINPLQDGTGLKVKVIESLSYGIPVVNTKKGLCGIRNDILSNFISADNPVDYADNIMRLLDDSDYYLEQSNIVQDIFGKNFSKEAVFEEFQKAFNI